MAAIDGCSHHRAHAGDHPHAATGGVLVVEHPEQAAGATDAAARSYLAKALTGQEHLQQATEDGAPAGIDLTQELSAGAVRHAEQFLGRRVGGRDESRVRLLLFWHALRPAQARARKREAREWHSG